MGRDGSCPSFFVSENGLEKIVPEKISEPDWRKPYPAPLKKNLLNRRFWRNKTENDALSG